MNSEQATPACRRKVHIALVGGQPAPVYNVIKATSPDVVEMVYSDKTKDVLDLLMQELNDFKIEGATKISATELNQIEECAKALANKYASDDITINISSGTKAWSHIFGVMFQGMDNAHVVYIDQNNVLWDFKTMTGERNFKFDMRTQFRLYNNPLKFYTPLSEYNENDDRVANEVEKIRKINPVVFNKLTITQNKKDKNKLNSREDRISAPDGFISWKKPAEKGDNTVVEIEIKNKYNTFNKTLRSPHAFELVFNAGWFEYKVAKMLERWDKSTEVLLNCTFPDKNNAPKNEVDVIVNAGTKIFFIECKTQISKITDIDKFRSVVKNYGGTASKGVFITEANKKDNAKEKCDQNSVIDITLNPQSCVQAIFDRLDEELVVSNA